MRNTRSKTVSPDELFAMGLSSVSGFTLNLRRNPEDPHQQRHCGNSNENNRQYVDQSSTFDHLANRDIPGAEGYRVWWCCDRQHECTRCRQGYRRVSMSGSMPVPIATPEATGRNVAAVAVFEVISVNRRMPTVTNATMTQTGRPESPSTWAPNHSDKPESENWADNARPPPNRSSTPQGNFTAVSQLRRRTP